MAKARRRLLYIEDDIETASLVAEELLDRGFELEIAHNGPEGILAIMKSTPDLVLCDIGLPGMTGFEVLERLTELAPRLGQIPFVFVTALTDRSTEIKGRQLGADDFVAKPIDFERLVLIINARLVGVARTRLLPSSVNLNKREIEVLTWVARGKTSAQIARQLKMSKRTVDFHIDNARIKLHAATRTEVVLKAVTGGLVTP
jgi:DNA-binding NarL/FixJ family response regulator